MGWDGTDMSIVSPIPYPDSPTLPDTRRIPYPLDIEYPRPRPIHDLN